MTEFDWNSTEYQHILTSLEDKVLTIVRPLFHVHLISLLAAARAPCSARACDRARAPAAPLVLVLVLVLVL